MKLLSKKGGRLEFEIEDWMLIGLTMAIQRFPMKEAPHQPLSKTMVLAEFQEDEKLIHESLKEIQDQNIEFGKNFLRGNPFQPIENNHWKLSIAESDIEPLLKIANQIRIGCWAKLGCPKDIHSLPEPPELREAFQLMHVCGIFQEALIETLE